MDVKPRSSTRVRTFLKARLVFNDGNSSLDAVIRDLSDSGARLQVGDSVALPDRFDVYIAKKDETRRARIRWRTKEELGISFEDSVASIPPPQPPSSDMTQRISQLEAEVAALSHLVEEMRAELQGGVSPERPKIAS